MEFGCLTRIQKIRETLENHNEVKIVLETSENLERPRPPAKLLPARRLPLTFVPPARRPSSCYAPDLILAWEARVMLRVPVRQMAAPATHFSQRPFFVGGADLPGNHQQRISLTAPVLTGSHVLPSRNPGNRQ